MGVPLFHFHLAAAGGVDEHLVAVPVNAAGAALQRGRLPRRASFGGLKIIGRKLVGMGQAALDEHVADRAHQQQQQGRHGGEAHDPPQHHFAGADRLGDDGVQRAALQVGRQAQRAEKQRQQQHQVAGGGEHEVEVHPGGIDALLIEIPAGEQQDQDEHREHHHHAAADRLLHRQARPAPRRAAAR